MDGAGGHPFQPCRPLLLGSLFWALLLVIVAAPAFSAGSSSVNDAQWQLTGSGIQRAWEVTRGDGVTVAVLDSGVDAAHPDLRGRVMPGGDFAGGASGTGLSDSVSPRGHGTEVASLVAGTGRNYGHHGLYGAAPAARVLSVGVFRNGTPQQGAIASAVTASVKRGAAVVLAPPLDVNNTAVRDAVRRAERNNVLVVAASPSARTGPTASGSLPGVLTVVAVDRQGRTLPGGAAARPTLAGPGVQVLAASSDGNYWTGDDNAFAAAWVAGSAALVRAARPGWTAAHTEAVLVGTASPDGACNGRCGRGVVDPGKAIAQTAATTASGSAGQAGASHTTNSLSSGAARLVWVAAVVVLLLLGAALGVVVAKTRRTQKVQAAESPPGDRVQIR